MRLEAFIAELLYEHDCVVLPGFGGLVANYRSARLNRKSHIIVPPSKHIGFNRNLLNNDGLLVNYIAHVAGIGYREALSRVEETISRYNEVLDREGRFAMEKIGVFFRDKGGSLQFIPDEQENFLLSSFGLTPVQLKPVAQEVPVNETAIIPINAERRRMAGWKVAAAIALPLLLVGSLLMRQQLKQNDNFSFASLNPFHTHKIVSLYDAGEIPLALAPMETYSGKLGDFLENSEGNLKYDFLRDTISSTGIEIENKKREIVPAVTTNVVPASDPLHAETTKAARDNRYAVIGGAFQVMENAENFLQKLKSDGFDASFAGRKDGLQLVAYGFYSSKAEANTALKNVQDAGGHAWIRRN